MKISNQGIEFIKRHEGLILQAYLCPANVWTIGYGHTLGVKSGQVITPQQAEQYLREDLKGAERSVNTMVKVVINQNKFDALVSFVFNLGTGNFQSSTLLKRINGNPADTDIANQFERWVFAKGVKLPGLVKRRKEESDLYFKL